MDLLNAWKFQYNNVNRGGQDLDNVIAEGIDYIDGARNNANFGTPVDGIRLRCKCMSGRPYVRYCDN
jgi:hypothetical protein